MNGDHQAEQQQMPGGGGGGAGGENTVLQQIRMARSELRGDDVEQATHFKPRRVSIGFYYHADEQLGCLENSKRRAVDRLCPPNGERRLHVLRWLRDKEEQLARECYALDQPPGDFVDMLLHDGCYVLNNIVPYRDGGGVGGVPIPLPTNGSEDFLVKMDILFLLENQMPWFVLKEMHSFIGTVDDTLDRESALHDHIANKGVRPLLEQLDFISGSRESANNPSTNSAGAAPAHLLDVVHYYLKPTAICSSREQQTAAPPPPQEAINIVPETAPPPRDRLRRVGRWRRATEYRRYANVQLKRRDLKKNKVDSILDVRLKRGTLWIPPVPFDPCTWTMLRNLIALEDHMAADKPKPVTAYCFFMSQLACTAEDVELLRRAGIVNHFLPTDKDAAQRFANLCNGVVFDAHDTNTNYLNATWHRLEKRCRRPGNTWLGSFLHKYCVDSLHVSAFLIAAMLFLLQTAQVTIAAISLADQLKKHPNNPKGN